MVALKIAKIFIFDISEELNKIAISNHLAMPKFGSSKVPKRCTHLLIYFDFFSDCEK